MLTGEGNCHRRIQLPDVSRFAMIFSVIEANNLSEKLILPTGAFRIYLGHQASPGLNRMK